MPGFNGTGPLGYGPVTGRGFGPCGGGRGYGYRGAGAGAGAGGFGRGLGRGRYGGYYPDYNLSKEDERGMLSEEAAGLEEELKNIKSRLAQLKEKK